MKLSYFATTAVLMLAALTFPLSAFALDAPFDHSTWQTFLDTFVDGEGNVDYRAVKQAPSLLDAYLGQIAAVDIDDFEYTWPREEKIALLINAYHAGVIRGVVRAYPVSSIQEIPSFWDVRILRIGKDRLSLNQIRKDQLVDVFRDEKVHTALACGARGCPRLRREAYEGAKVEGQLFLATKEFVNDPRFREIVPHSKAIRLSPLYKWYARDFTLDFASVEDRHSRFSIYETAVLSFIVYYSDDPDVIQFLETRDYKVKYLSFDWDLNDRTFEDPDDR